MTPSALVASLTGRGAKLSARDGRLVIDAPAGTVTPDDRAELARLKAAVLALLAAGPELPSWPPRPAELAGWPVESREKWGRRANELEDAGLDWRSAERQAFGEVKAERSAGGVHIAAALPPVEPPTVEPEAPADEVYRPRAEAVLPLAVA